MAGTVSASVDVREGCRRRAVSPALWLGCPGFGFGVGFAGRSSG